MRASLDSVAGEVVCDAVWDVATTAVGLDPGLLGLADVGQVAGGGLPAWGPYERRTAAGPSDDDRGRRTSVGT